MKNSILLFLLSVSLHSLAQQSFVANYDENKVGEYTLPNALLRTDGTLATNTKDWEKQRKYWLGEYERVMFGKMPKEKIKQTSRLISKTEVMNGKAIQYVWELTFADKYTISILGVLPTSNKKSAVFLGLNFCGNQTTSLDKNIPISNRYVVCNGENGYKNHLGDEGSRGLWASRWQFEKIIAAGLGSITVSCADFEEDHEEGYKKGVRTLLAKELGLGPDEWSANGAWAWGLSRVVDFLTTQSVVDSKHIILHGHSRLGKAALWAGVNDQRFSAVISNESGEGGAAIARRNYGENLWRITNNFPHWFFKDYKNYAYKENELPFDSNILLGLLAPRPLYVTSAVGDQWSDPMGEFLGAKWAEPIYHLYHHIGLGETSFPALNTPVGQRVQYHIREGKHDINEFDWTEFIRFANESIK
ncbi:glucuronyl esterase domain-containing protein [Aquirufa sp. ROCK2-A2]